MQLGVAIILGNIGSVYWSESNYPKALEYHQKALRINEKIVSQEGIASNLANIGTVYYSQSNYDSHHLLQLPCPLAQ